MNWKIQVFAAVAALLLSASALPAADDVSGLQQAKAEEICAAVKSTIADGIGSKVVVQTAIMLGHKPCQVVRCAIEGGGDLEQILAGAASAGCSTEVASRCAIDAGAPADEVARLLSLPEMGINLCYFQPPGAAPSQELSAEAFDLPASDPFPSAAQGTVISPFAFP